MNMPTVPTSPHISVPPTAAGALGATLGLAMVGAAITVGVKVAGWASDHMLRVVDNALGMPPKITHISLLVAGPDDQLPLAVEGQMMMNRLRAHGATKETVIGLVEASLPSEEEAPKAKKKAGAKTAATTAAAAE